MKALGNFNKNGFYYELVEREGNLAIYKQRQRPGVGFLAYELIRVRTLPAGVLFGQTVEAREACPRNEDWGKFGWTFPTLEAARQKMRDLQMADAARSSVSVKE